MSLLAQQDPDVFRAIELEDARQRDCVVLIASENYASKAVLEAQTSVMNNKYAEGYPGRRYYGGCEHVDVVESLAIEPGHGVVRRRTRQRPAPQRRPGQHGRLLRPAGAGRHRNGDGTVPRRSPDPRRQRQFLRQAVQLRPLRRGPGQRAYQLRRGGAAGEGTPGPSSSWPVAAPTPRFSTSPASGPLPTRWAPT